jgi:peroxiredoxin
MKRIRVEIILTVEITRVKRKSFSLAAVLIAAVFLSLAGAGVAHARKANYKVGDTIADFALKSDKGQTVRLSQFRGKVVVIDFYASWCPSCNEAAPHVEKEIWQKYKSRNVQVLGIAVQEGEGPAAKFQKFRKEHGVTYPLLLDEPGNVIQKFGFVGIPQGIVIDAKGKYVSAPDSVAGINASLEKLTK